MSKVIMILVSIATAASLLACGSGVAEGPVMPIEKTGDKTTSTKSDAVSSAFVMTDNSVDYYIKLDAPGKIQVVPTFQDDVGFDISILDEGNKTKASLQTYASGFPVEYEVSHAEWQRNQVWRVNFTNMTMVYDVPDSAGVAVDIQYPNASNQVFRDDFIVHPGAAISNVVVNLPAAGVINAHADWGDNSKITAGIRLPNQDENFFVKQSGLGDVSVSYDVKVPSVSQQWIVSLMLGPAPSSLTTVNGAITVQVGDST